MSSMTVANDRIAPIVSTPEDPAGRTAFDVTLIMLALLAPTLLALAFDGRQINGADV